MQAAIHPRYETIHVTCSCGEKFDTRSTLVAEKNELHIDVCSKCHPFYTGKQKLVDTSGRIDRFRQRYASKEQKIATTTAAAAAPAKAKAKAKKGTSA